MTSSLSTKLRTYLIICKTGNSGILRTPTEAPREWKLASSKFVTRVFQRVLCLITFLHSQRNVSFAYPNAENVIKDVSFTVRRGQTVIIVGVNGSGKSTLLKLFNRLHDPTTGTVSVDGVPMQSFHAKDLRRASAMLFQNYSHFPLSIRENIAMGLPDEELLSTQGEKNVEHVDPIVEAARLGGAEEFIRAQKDGFDTVLKPLLSAWSSSSGGRMGHVFKKRMKEINKSTDVSHGQWQRLALCVSPDAFIIIYGHMI